MLVVRLKPYLRAMAKMGFDDRQMRDVEAMILAAPESCPVVQGLRGVRKARFARPGRGKRGGGRAIFYVALLPDRLFMMTAYPKNERDDLSSAQRKAILAAIESIKGG
jgi:anti-sigma factor RsiW